MCCASLYEEGREYMRLGRHLSGSAGAVATSEEIGGETMQIFLTNPKGWQPPALHPEEAAKFRASVSKHGQEPVVVHAAYIINLASPNDDTYARSIRLLRATLERASAYGTRYVVLHIGSHTGSGEEAGMARLVEGLRQSLGETPEDVVLLLENDTGGGGKLGYRFENLAAALDALPEHDRRLGVCLDTAHLFGAGFDVGTPAGAEHTLAVADQTLGLERVPVLHINDAKATLGSHRDLHARLGEGNIGLEGLGTFLRSPKLAHAAGLLETPYFEHAPGKTDWEAERAQLAHLRELVEKP